MEQYRIKYQPLGDYNITKQFRKSVSQKGQDNISEIVDLYDLYNQEKSSTYFRYYGTIDFISPLANKNSNLTSISDLFQIVNSSKFDFLEEFYFYFGKYIGDLIDPVTGSKTKKYQITDSQTSIDIERCGFSTNIFGTEKYNFLIHNDVQDDTERAFIVSHIELNENSVVYGDIYSGDTLYDTSFGVYETNIGVMNPLTLKLKYKLCHTLNNSKDLPFTSNYHYSYNHINFVMRADDSDLRTYCIFEPYVFRELEQPRYVNNNPLNNC